MGPAFAPAGVQDPCCAGELVSVGRISRVFLLLCLVAGCQALAAAGQPAVALGAQGLQPFWRSGWFVLSWLLASFLHSRHGITITKCHHRFGSSARQTGYIKGPGCSLALARVSRALAQEVGYCPQQGDKKVALCTAWLAEELAPVDSLSFWEILQPARRPGASARVPSGSLAPVGL